MAPFYVTIEEWLLFRLCHTPGRFSTPMTIEFIITIKVAIDFIQSNGLDYIIQVPKGSRAAAAVSVCLYYLAFNNDAMERLNQYPEYKLDRVVDYTLDLIETKPGFTHRKSELLPVGGTLR